MACRRPAEIDRRVTAILAGVGAAAAVGLMVYMAFFSSGRAAADEYQAMHAQCKACGGQFTIAAEAAAAERAAAGDPRKDLNCPLCGKKNAASTMTRCDRCGKYYLPPENAAAGQRKCSHCGFDPDAR